MIPQYENALAAWMLENWADAKPYHGRWTGNSWFQDKRPLTQEILVEHFTSLSPNSVVGNYFIQEDGTAKHLCFDIDAHKPGEVSEPKTKQLVAFLNACKIPFVLASSKGGRGYHPRIRFSPPIPEYAARRFGELILARSGLPRDTEVNPKTGGNLVALPGSRHFIEKTGGGGSSLVDPLTLEAIPFENWLACLESVPPVKESYLRELSEEGDVDFFAPPAPRFDYKASGIKLKAEGVPDLKSVADVLSFLSLHHLNVKRVTTTGTAKWPHKFILDRCPNEKAHGSDRGDGAGVIFNPVDGGQISFWCFHSGCNKFHWADLLRLLGYDAHYVKPENPAIPPTPPDFTTKAKDGEACGFADLPPELPQPPEPTASYSWRERDYLARLAMTHFDPGSRPRTRLIRVSGCSQAVAPYSCEAHGKDHERHMPCEKATLCPYCASKRAEHQYMNVLERWPAKVHVLTFSSPNPREIRRRIVAGFWRQTEYRWLLGINKGAFFCPWDKASKRLESIAKKLAEEGIEIKYQYRITRAEAARIVYDVWTEPAAVFSAAVRASRHEDVIDFHFLADDKVNVRCGAARHHESFPWLSEIELREDLVEEACERRGVDLLHCSHREHEDDLPCGKPLTPIVVDSRDGEVLYAPKRREEPFWSLAKRGFATLCAKRMHAAASMVELAHSNLAHVHATP